MVVKIEEHSDKFSYMTLIGMKTCPYHTLSLSDALNKITAPYIIYIFSFEDFFQKLL